VDENRFVLIACRYAMPRISALLDADAGDDLLVPATYGFVITAERLIQYARAAAWPKRN
jgi:hypothetical protein